MDSVNLRGKSVRIMASASSRLNRCPAILKVWKKPARWRSACSGSTEYPKPDSTRRLMASVSSASITTRGVTLISTELSVDNLPHVASLGIKQEGNISQVGWLQRSNASPTNSLCRVP